MKKLLPLIIQSLRDSLRHPMNSHTRSSKEYFFGIVRTCIGEMAELVTTSGGIAVGDGEVRNADVGLFVKKLDGVMDFLGGKGDNPQNFDKFNVDVEWVVRFSLSVAKVSRKRSEEEEVIEASREALRYATELGTSRKSGDEGASPASDSELRDSCRDSIEVLEQTVNNCLLKLIIELFCTSSVNSPLDDLIHRILNSTVSPPDRLPEDVDDLVDAFDDHADTLFHVAHYTAFCTTDAKRYVIQSIGPTDILKYVLFPNLDQINGSGDVAATDAAAGEGSGTGVSQALLQPRRPRREVAPQGAEDALDEGGGGGGVGSTRHRRRHRLLLRSKRGGEGGGRDHQEGAVFAGNLH